MTKQIGEQHAGFELQDVQVISEIKSIAYTWVHKETKLKLLYLENNDDNKLFLIGFRTPPGDSTGVPHIIEHSVLCGSDKFPLKDPFLEMIKGSMNTFINAMTFPDKTVYPVASQNDQDFQNLMDIYMDAVLHPVMKREKKIFQQEGWHHEILKQEDPVSIQGIVYNEMKGAYSTPESMLELHMLPSLFPHTPYRHNSGGNPDCIPDLTYEDFVAFHNRYYHPTNGFIILYGNGNMEKQLAFLQEEYLKDYIYQPVDSRIPLEPAFTERKTVEYAFPAQDQESGDDKTYFSLHYALSPIQDSTTHMAWDVLTYMLLDSPTAPLKKALIDAGLGVDVLGGVDKSLLQPVFSIISKHASKKDKDRFVRIVEETLSGFIQKGFDKKLIESSLNHFEFRLKEADYQGFPKGLVYALFMVLDSWLYDGKPTLHLAYQAGLERMKQALTTPFFEELIQKGLLQNLHQVLLVGSPDRDMAEETVQKNQNEMAEFKSNLSEKELQGIIQASIDLKRYQSQEDSDEIKMKIPQLSLQDIRQDALWIPQSEKILQQVRYLVHPIDTNGIVYVKWLFPFQHLPMSLLPFVSLMTDLLGQINTKQHDYETLSQEIDLSTGGIDFATEIVNQYDSDTVFTPYLTVQTKFFPRYLNKALSLIHEILSDTTWDQPKRIRELLQEYCSRFEMNLFFYGTRYVLRRVHHYYSPAAYIQEHLDGIEYYQWAKEWLQHLDKDFDRFIASLEQVRASLLKQIGRVVSITADPSIIPSIESDIEQLNQNWSPSVQENAHWDLPLQPVEEGIQTCSRVQYVAKGYNFKRNGHSYHGSYLVIDNLLSYDYLWSQIRVQGGAYGANSQITRHGNVGFASYRDPHLKETIGVYQKAGAFLSSFQGSQRVVNSYIIGTLSSLDYPLTPSQKGDRATKYAMSGITKQFLNQEREQIFRTTLKEIQAFAPILEECMKQPYTCVLGNDKAIEAEKNLFNRLTKLAI